MIENSILFYRKGSKLISVYRRVRNSWAPKDSTQAALTSGIAMQAAAQIVIFTNGDHANRPKERSSVTWAFYFTLKIRYIVGNNNA
jgi:hypothetical protein